MLSVFLSPLPATMLAVLFAMTLAALAGRSSRSVSAAMDGRRILVPAAGGPLAPAGAAQTYRRPCDAVSRRTGFASYRDRLCVHGRLYADLVGSIVKTIEGNERHHMIEEIVIDSLGGHLHAALELGKRIADSELTVRMPSGGYCESACILVLAMARNAIVERGATVAAHFAVYALEVRGNHGPAGSELNSVSAR